MEENTYFSDFLFIILTCLYYILTYYTCKKQCLKFYLYSLNTRLILFFSKKKSFLYFLSNLNELKTTKNVNWRKFKIRYNITVMKNNYIILITHIFFFKFFISYIHIVFYFTLFSLFISSCKNSHKNIILEKKLCTRIIRIIKSF